MIYFLFVFLFFSCSEKNEHGLEDNSLYAELSEKDHAKFLEEYDGLKKNISEKRKALSNSDDKTVSKYIVSVMTDSLFHFWYDTPWDFNGITQTPHEGKIACGYFVTTTLLHTGFDLPRVKLAQQAASIIIRTLCSKESIKTFTGKNFEGLKKYLQKSENGLYIIGLDNHVGFIHKKDTLICMIHADYINDKVCRERIDDCRAILNSKFHMVGNLSGNMELMKKWKNQTAIEMQD